MAPSGVRGGGADGGGVRGDGKPLGCQEIAWGQEDKRRERRRWGMVEGLRGGGQPEGKGEGTHILSSDGSRDSFLAALGLGMGMCATVAPSVDMIM